jgi:hypothetical protein
MAIKIYGYAGSNHKRVVIPDESAEDAIRNPS